MKIISKKKEQSFIGIFHNKTLKSTKMQNGKL